MALPLSAADLARLEAANRALLAPLAFDHADDWREASMRAVCEVVGAESATFYLPGQERLVAYTGLDPQFGDLIEPFTGAAWLGGGTSPDPILPLFHRALVRRGVEVWNMHTADHLLGGGGVAWRSMFHDEVLRPLRAGDTHALFVARPEGSYMLGTHTFHREPDPTDHLPALRVLLPAFKAGLDAHTRLRASRAALDAVSEPLAAFSADGAPLHRNGALEALLAADPEAPHVEVALAALAARLRPLAFARRADAPAVTPPTAEARTARAAYALRAALLPAGALGHGEAFLVTVEPRGLAAALPSADAVRQSLGLTRREAEVALLVAEGLSNEAIAERLFVSTHTVRHHVESAMAKLDLTGRGREAIAARLLAG
ncbi:hypothetical protein BSZ37_12860 [Rubrivirga marina]|uniref:HTH luxR-type domain-containing protein n=2 Tax=Rubrivirga marina TaxID=1196024 RepID=A0A271J1M9_9BACT|nr:hypothetical protein BSZ37_12860 [Rubrivirga marina]